MGQYQVLGGLMSVGIGKRLCRKKKRQGKGKTRIGSKGKRKKNIEKRD